MVSLILVFEKSVMFSMSDGAPSYRTVNAIWLSFLAFVKHSTDCSTDGTRNGRERAKCFGMKNKLVFWSFSYEMAITRDAFETISSLSLYLQRRDASVLITNRKTATTIKTLAAMKEHNRVSLNEFLEDHQKIGSFHSVTFPPPTDGTIEKASRLRLQFFQNLVDNLTFRFAVDKPESVLENAKVLQSHKIGQTIKMNVCCSVTELLSAW